MQVTLRCIRCGSEKFDVKPNQQLKHGDKIRCLSCGKISDFTEMMKKAVECATEEYVRNNRASIVAGASPVTDPKEIEMAEKLKNSGS